jgi:aspartyl-tRNA(Asn)/glutamyl-tRNA(Gln) amidotransferase subunit A
LPVVRTRCGAIKKIAESKGDSALPFASIGEVARLYRGGKLSPVELTEFMLERIARLNPELNAFITVTADHARARAKKAESELSVTRRRKTAPDRGALHGIPISLKDNIYTAGIRTTAGSAVLRDFIPTTDAPVVTRLQQAGAILLGKTNMHEFAYGVTTNNPHYGAAHNPWDLNKISGGSSGGSAVALAAGLSFGSIGTDTGGSIRIPAALCGVVGLKPTRDVIDASGVIPLSQTLDCVGPMARTVEDTAILFGAISGHASGSRSAGKAPSRNLTKLRLGLPREFFFDVISPEVEKLFQSALRPLRRLGAKILDVSIPSLLETESAGNLIGWAEATHYHQQSGWFPSRAAEYSEDVRSRLEAGTKVSATAYLEALEQRQKFIDQLRAVMEAAKLDALVVPTVPIAAPGIGEENIRIGAKEHPTRALLLRLNRPANLAGVPAISVPCGFTPAGLPVGLQFIGGANGENVLLSMAGAYERLNAANKHPNF